MHFITLNGFNPGPYTGRGTNAYLILGRDPTLVDAASGDPRFVESIAAALAEHGAPGLARVLLTHAHSDHASGTQAVLERWPDVILMKLPWPERDARYAPGERWTAIADDELVPAGDGVLRALHTPGHAPDHLCFLDESSGTAFVGDLALARGTVMIPASHGGSLAQYLTSIRRMLALAPRRLLPGHGDPIDDPLPLLRAYLAHRQEREEQIVRALDTGLDTADAIVARIYLNLSPDLVPAALESVLAHLAKLREEGRATADGARWRLRADEPEAPPSVFRCSFLVPRSWCALALTSSAALI